MDTVEYLTEAPRRWWDPFVTVAVAVAAFGLLSAWPYPILHPSAWNDVAVAAGLRAPVAPSNGLYRALLFGLFHVFPSDAVLKALPLLGRLAIALATAGVYTVFVDVFPAALRLTTHIGRLGSRISRVVALLAALLFLVSDPVWRAGQTFSPATLFIAENVLAWGLLFCAIRRGKLWPLSISAALMGSLAAESFGGLALSFLAAYVLVRAVLHAGNPDVPFVHPLMNEVVRAFVFVRLCNLWLAGVALQLAGDFWLFKSLGGLTAAGCAAPSDYLVVFLKTLLAQASGAATPLGWLFAVLVSLVPFFLALRLLPQAWDDDRFLPYAVGILFLLLGGLSLAQVSGYRPFQFWHWVGDNPMVVSDSLLAVLLTLNVAVCAFALAVFGIDTFCRNYARLAQQMYPEAAGTDEAAQTLAAVRRRRTRQRRLYLLVLVLLPALLVWGCRQPRERGMMRLMGEYAEEVFAELGTREVLFTDGSYDVFLELRALECGRKLWPLSLMAPNTPAEIGVRLRASENDEDAALLERGAATTLRAWLAAKSPCLARAGVQLGFEFWRREGADLPPLAGLMALPGGEMSEVDAAWFRATCADLAARIHQLDKAHNLSLCTDRAVRRLFPYVPWRLARLAALQGQVYDKAGRRAEAFEAAATADELDGVNYALKQLYRDTRWLNRQSSGALLPTPREGLVIGLVRADFLLAAQFAQPILKADPDDPRANFAVGMKYYMEEQYARAEHHLARCLKRRPKEPATLNNLAMAQLKQGKLDAAEEHARAALALLPASKEIQRTLESIKKARTERAQAAPEAH